MNAVCTVIGKDRVGIIARVSGFMAENNINILDISQTIMQEYFTMIMLVDVSGVESLEKIKDGLDSIGAELGLKIMLQHKDVFEAMHRI